VFVGFRFVSFLCIFGFSLDGFCLLWVVWVFLVLTLGLGLVDFCCKVN
jgi:hypothetical protein